MPFPSLVVYPKPPVERTPPRCYGPLQDRYDALRAPRAERQPEDRMSFFDAVDWEGKLFNGGWVAGHGGFPAVTDAATGHILGNISLASTDDLASSVIIASAAQYSWARMHPSGRAAVLRKAGSLVEEHSRVFSGWLIKEAGVPRARAELEAAVAAESLYASAASIESPTTGDGTIANTALRLTRRVPLGTVGVVAPTDYPLAVTASVVASVIADGNAAIVVAPPRVAVSGGLVLAAALDAAGLHPGVLTVLPGDTDLARELAAHPQVRGISYTGTSSGAREFALAAAENSTRAVVTPPTYSALLVAPGADVSVAVAAGVSGAFTRSDRIARGCGVHLVHESLFEVYVDQLALVADTLGVGDPANVDVVIGPLLDEAERDRVHAVVTGMVTGGARLASGGRYQGLLYRPTVLADPTGASLPPTDGDGGTVTGAIAVVVPWASPEEALELLERLGSVGFLDIVGADSTVALDFADRSAADTVTLVGGSAHARSDDPERGSLAGVGEARAGGGFWTEQRIILPVGGVSHRSAG